MDSTNHEARNPLAAITLCAEDVHTTMETLIQQSSAPQLSIERDAALAGAGPLTAEPLAAELWPGAAEAAPVVTVQWVLRSGASDEPELSDEP